MTRTRHISYVFVLATIIFAFAGLFAFAGPVRGEAVTDHLPASTVDTLSIDDLLQELLENLDPEDERADDLAEEVSDLMAHPLNINAAGTAELMRIPFVDAPLAARLRTARHQHGPFDSIAEAFEAAEIDTDTAARLRPFLTARDRESGRRLVPPLQLDELRVDLFQRMTRRLDVGRGYSEDTTRTTYLGGPERLYTRVRIRAGPHVDANLTLDKRPGEPFHWDPSSRTYGYNHVAAHLALRQFGRVESLVIGDYTVLFGQGVALWRPSAFGKGRDTVRPAARHGSGIHPYGSTDRNRFFRGVAGTFRLVDGLHATAFVSRKRLDATLEDMGPDNEPVITALPSSGLHRTASERARKGATRAHVTGGALSYRYRESTIGISAHQTRFDHIIRPDPVAHRMFDFAGQDARIVSAFASLQIGTAHLFGEVARDHDETMSGTAGLQLPIDNQGNAVLLFRHYPRDFISLHGSAFTESSGQPVNETGVYTGVDFRPAASWRIAAYFDQFRFPWRRFGVPRPSSGHDALVLLEHMPRPGMSVYLQGRTKTRERGAPAYPATRNIVLDAVQPVTRQALRLHGTYRVSSRVRFQTRIEKTRFLDIEREAHYGTLLYQDVRWQLHGRLQLDMRLTLFDARDFGARLFAYENDLLYAFSVPMLSGTGQRAYALARWRGPRGLTLELKLAETRYEDVETIGSGLDEIEGNRLREMRAQLRWSF